MSSFRPARGLGEPGQNNPRFMFKRLSKIFQLKMQNFLKSFDREVAKVSGCGVSWEGLGERWCETSKPRGYAP